MELASDKDKKQRAGSWRAVGGLGFQFSRGDWEWEATGTSAHAEWEAELLGSSVFPVRKKKSKMDKTGMVRGAFVGAGVRRVRDPANLHPCCFLWFGYQKYMTVTNPMCAIQPAWAGEQQGRCLEPQSDNQRLPADSLQASRLRSYVSQGHKVLRKDVEKLPSNPGPRTPS